MWGRFHPSGESGWGAGDLKTKDLSKSASKHPAKKDRRGPILKTVIVYYLLPASFVRQGCLTGKEGRCGRLHKLVNPRNGKKVVSFPAKDPNVLHILKRVCNTLRGSKPLFSTELALKTCFWGCHRDPKTSLSASFSPPLPLPKVGWRGLPPAHLAHCGPRSEGR